MCPRSCTVILNGMFFLFFPVFFSKNLLLDGEMATPCGHTFCGFCVNKFKNEAAGRVITCGVCRQPITAFFKNHLATTMLGMVDGECLRCKGTFPLNAAKDHLKHCQEVEVNCNYCGIALKRRDEASHQTTCLMVDVACQCGAVFKRAEEENHKETTCRLREVPCPLDCGKKIKW